MRIVFYFYFQFSLVYVSFQRGFSHLVEFVLFKMFSFSLVFTSSVSSFRYCVIIIWRYLICSEYKLQNKLNTL